MSDRLRVLALATYPNRIASTRFRIGQYIPMLATRGIDVELSTMLDDASARAFYAPGSRAAKAAGVARRFARQLVGVAASKPYDVVFVQREAALVGPPLIEALASRAGRTPLVFDFDDAVWIYEGSTLGRLAKFASKASWLVRQATHVVAGSEHLAAYARGLGARTTVVPTVVSRAEWAPSAARLTGAWASEDGAPRVLGWVGSHSTAPQLALVAPALRRLRAEGRSFVVRVAGADASFALDGVEIERVPWSLAGEVELFRQLDIGLAPMFSTPWHEGKCGFKQVQYMAVGVPHVSSQVGGARDFVRHEENALVARSPEDWYDALVRLWDDRPLRARLASRGRELVEERLSTEVQVDVLARTLRAAAAR